MRKSILAAVAAAVVFLAAAPESRAGGFELGMGANYWYSIKEAKDRSFDRDGLGWMVSSRIMLTDLFGIGLEIEKSPDKFLVLDEPLYIPAAYAIIGDTIYVGVGFGGYYYDGDFWEETWYAFRGGFKIPLSRILALDINVNYRFENWDSPEQVAKDIDSDTLMVGAALRLVF